MTNEQIIELGISKNIAKDVNALNDHIVSVLKTSGYISGADSQEYQEIVRYIIFHVGADLKINDNAFTAEKLGDETNPYMTEDVMNRFAQIKHAYIQTIINKIMEI